MNEDCITENDRRHRLVSEYLQAADPSKEKAVATALRPTLEAFMRVACPHDFPPGTLLGKFHELCQRRVGLANEILSSHHVAELRALLDYVNKFHHDTNSAAETEYINDQELSGFAARTLRFAAKT